jgi:hypothetical protein
MSTRLPDWSARLQALVARRLTAPFVWGSNDCGLFAADNKLALTGVDPAADLRGRYASEREARRLLRPLGGLVRVACARFGPEVPPELAQRGDVGLCVNERRVLLAVCNGDHWLAPAAHGLVPLERAQRAWRV